MVITITLLYLLFVQHVTNVFWLKSLIKKAEYELIYFTQNLWNVLNFTGMFFVDFILEFLEPLNIISTKKTPFFVQLPLKFSTLTLNQYKKKYMFF